MLFRSHRHHDLSRAGAIGSVLRPQALHDLRVRGARRDEGELRGDVGGQGDPFGGRPRLKLLGHVLRHVPNVKRRHTSMLALCNQAIRGEAPPPSRPTGAGLLVPLTEIGRTPARDRQVSAPRSAKGSRRARSTRTTRPLP